jgi:hypothetical protein
MVAATEVQLPATATDSPHHPMAENKFGDCIFQIQSVLLAHRLCLYHQNEEIRYRIFPNGGAEQVIHLEKFAGDNSPNELLLFKNLAVPQIEFKNWLESSFIRFSITRLYFLDGLEATSREVRVNTFFRPPATANSSPKNSIPPAFT